MPAWHILFSPLQEWHPAPSPRKQQKIAGYYSDFIGEKEGNNKKTINFGHAS